MTAKAITRIGACAALALVGTLEGCSSTDPPVRLIEQEIFYGNNVYVSHSGASNGPESEQSLVMVWEAGVRKLLAAYNDKRDFAGTGSLDGWSTSTDATQTTITWTPHPPMPTPAYDPMSPTRVLTLDGDPWLAASSMPQWDSVVYYSSLATQDPGGAKVVALARSDKGGLDGTWSEFQRVMSSVPGERCAGRHDKPSMDVSDDGSNVWIAYVCDEASVRVAHSADGGASWREATVALVYTTTANPAPIVKRNLEKPGSVFVAWEDDPDVARRLLRFSRSDDGGATWGGPVDAVSEPTTDPTFRGFGGRDPRSRVHFSFEIDPGNYHCDLAFDLDGTVRFTSSTDGVTWDPPLQVVPDAGQLKHFQPMLRASATRLAIIYYQQDHSGPSPNTVVKARMSADHGQTWPSTAGAFNMQISFVGGAFATDGFQPCSDSTNGNEYFGDYLGLTPLVTPGETPDMQLAKRFFGAWADSRPSCLGHTPAIHQHSVGQLFGSP